MAISTNCSLNLFPPPPASTSASSPISRTPQVLSCPPTPKERPWKNPCLLGLTCAIIGLQIGDFAVVGDQERAFAMDMQSGQTTIIIKVPRWSDRRACLPWRVNSLETIVPENLPRPSARRRWEATGFSETAPPVKAVVKSGAKSCFNL